MSIESRLLWQQKWPILQLVGSGSKGFLQGQTTADLVSSKEGDFIYGCCLKTNGTFRSLLEMRIFNDKADIIALAGDIETLKKDFEKIIFPADRVTVQQIGEINRLQLIDFQNPQRFNDVEWISIDGTLPKHLSKFSKATDEEIELWRINKGLPLSNLEIELSANPFELGLSEFISLDKGCYMGQEAIARLLRSDQLTKKLKVWESDIEIEKGQKVFKKDLSKPNNIQIVGTITSSIKDKSSKHNYGLAMIKKKAFLEKELFIEGDLERKIYFKSSIPD